MANSKEHTPTDLMVFRSLARVLADFRTAGQSDKITIGLFQTLLVVSNNEGENQKTIATACHASVAATSRNLMGLDEKTKSGVAGMGLITSRRSPVSDREKIYFLSAKGKAFLERTLATLKGE